MQPKPNKRRGPGERRAPAGLQPRNRHRGRYDFAALVSAFVCRMISESALMPERCLWFSSRIVKSANLPAVYEALRRAGWRTCVPPRWGWAPSPPARWP